VLWAYSVPVAFGILAILILRMALHKLPHESMAASSWLALGPIGTGALGMLVLGRRARHPRGARARSPSWRRDRRCRRAAAVGLWPVVAGARDADHHPLLARWRPFNLWWGYTFPLGVYTVATFRLGTTLTSAFFGIVGTVLTVALAAMWLSSRQDAGRRMAGNCSSRPASPPRTDPP
jgi:tellurite resistance protein TehA-like permease